MIYDVIIIGGSPAGLTAGIYIARKKLNAVVLTKNVGGQCLLTDTIENFPGFDLISGRELSEKMRAQTEKYGVSVKEGVEVESIEKKNGNFLINLKGEEKAVKPPLGGLTAKQNMQARAIIIATGKSPNKLRISGEKEFENKGVSFCTTCDAPLFAGKDVAVIGGGNSGLNAALDLVKYANKVYILEYGPKIIGDELLQERLKQSGKAEFFVNAEAMEIRGDSFVEKIIYQDKKSGGTKEIFVGGVFVNAGWLPATGFLSTQCGVDLNEKREIIINPKTNETSVQGIFAAGDVTDVKYKQCVIAAGEGAKAALSAYEYLIMKKNNSLT